MPESQGRKVFRIQLTLPVVVILTTLSTFSLAAAFYLGMVIEKSMQRPPDPVVETDISAEKPLSEEDLKFFGLSERNKEQETINLEELRDLKKKTEELTKVTEKSELKTPEKPESVTPEKPKLASPEKTALTTKDTSKKKTPKRCPVQGKSNYQTSQYLIVYAGDMHIQNIIVFLERMFQCKPVYTTRFSKSSNLENKIISLQSIKDSKGRKLKDITAVDDLFTDFY